MKKKLAILAGFMVLAAGAWGLWAGWKSQRSQRTAVMVPVAKTEGGVGDFSASSSYPVPAASGAPSQVTENDRKLLGDLKEIFASKNDNDPRLDTEFRNLTPGTKRLLREEYDKLAPESLNERGTIVFLLGRELETPGDFAFLARVGDQPACLSLGDCKKEAPASEESMHEEVAVSVTLTYPQRVALKSLENLLSQPQVSPTQARMALDTLGSITESPIGPIAQKAAELQARYSSGH